MGSCLVTKLKESVNNDSLRYIGEMTFTLNGSNVSDVSQRFLQIRTTDSVLVKSTSTAYTDSSLSNPLGKDFNLNSGTTLMYFPKENGVFRVIGGKYCLNMMVCGSAFKLTNIGDVIYTVPISLWKNVSGADTDASAIFGGDLDELDGVPNASVSLKVVNTGFYNFAGVKGSLNNFSKLNFAANTSGLCRVRLNNSTLQGTTSVFRGHPSTSVITAIDTDDSNVPNIIGNVEDFENYTNMTVFDLNKITLTGNLATGLGHMTKLTDIYISSHSESEDVANLFNALHSNGKKSGSIICYLGTNKTLNGSTWQNGKTVTFTSSGWTVN